MISAYVLSVMSLHTPRCWLYCDNQPRVTFWLTIYIYLWLQLLNHKKKSHTVNHTFDTPGHTVQTYPKIIISCNVIMYRHRFCYGIWVDNILYTFYCAWTVFEVWNRWSWTPLFTTTAYMWAFVSIYTYFLPFYIQYYSHKTNIPCIMAIVFCTYMASWILCAKELGSSRAKIIRLC